MARDPDDKLPRSTTKRVAWFVAIYAASVAVIGAVAYLIRLWIV